LSSVLSDLFGKSGTIKLKDLIQNKPVEEIIKSLPKKMKGHAYAISAALSASIPLVLPVLPQ
jgi:hypothetical protein